MSTDVRPLPSESPADALKRKLRELRQRAAAWWASGGAMRPPAPPVATVQGASDSASPARRRRTGNAQRPLIWITGVALFAMAAANQYYVTEHGPVWRMLLAIAGFLYLWWLSSLVFDLVFVWHRYIRADAALRFLRTEVAPASFGGDNDRPTDDGQPAVIPIPPSTPGPSGDRPIPVFPPDFPIVSIPVTLRPIVR